MMFGLDLLGLAKFRRAAVKAFPHDFALGAFSNLDGFGDALPAVDAILSTGRCPRVRLHLSWDDRHDIRDLVAIEREAMRVGRFFEHFPNIDRRVSGGCEHTWGKDLANEVAHRVMRHMPVGVQYVNVPLLGGPKRGALLNGVINECHGSGAKPLDGHYDFSFDGSSSVDSDVTSIFTRLKSADTKYLWIPQFNGRKTVQDTTPRPKRKAWPTPDLIHSVAFLTSEKGIVSLPGNLIKTHADQHLVPPESRAWKPVCIFKQKASKVEFLLDSGRVLASASYGGTFDGGGFRYYVGQWGFKLAKRAKKIQGHPVLKVRINGQIVGRVNLGFRIGGFR